MADRGSARAKALGIELFSGRLSPAAAARTEKVKALMARLVGPDGPDAPKPEPSDPRPRIPERFFRLAMTAKHRAEAEKTATELVRRFIARDFAAIEPLAHEHVFVTWPSGQVVRHKRGTLVEALKSRGGDRVAAEPNRVKAYGMSELAAILPRGVTEAISAFFDAPNGVLVTMQLDDKRGIALNAAIMTSPDPKERWRAHNLPFAAVDDAARASVAPKIDEDESLVVADRIVRHFVLGHAQHVRSLRNLMVDRIFIGAEIADAEVLAKKAGEGPNAIERLETVFLGTDPVDPPRSLADLLKKRSQEAWRKPVEKLPMKVCRTRIAELDPERGRAAQSPPGEVVSLLLGLKEREALRWRFGGLFL
jgi:hypothetical protein